MEAKRNQRQLGKEAHAGPGQLDTFGLLAGASQ